MGDHEPQDTPRIRRFSTELVCYDTLIYTTQRISPSQFTMFPVRRFKQDLRVVKKLHNPPQKTSFFTVTRNIASIMVLGTHSLTYPSAMEPARHSKPGP